MRESIPVARGVGGLGWLVLGMVLAMTGCVILPFAGDDAVEMRVENATEVAFSEIRVYWEPMQTFTNLGPGERTAYVAVDRAYHIATVVAVTATDSTRIQVIDFVGEEPLEEGRYTLVLSSVNPSGPQLRLTERVEKD